MLGGTESSFFIISYSKIPNCDQVVAQDIHLRDD